MIKVLAITKQGEYMKTITITLTPEQETILLTRINNGWGTMANTDLKYLTTTYKKTNDFTKDRIKSAKKSLAKRLRERELAEGFVEQVQNQLGKKPSTYNDEIKDLLEKEVTDDNYLEIIKRRNK